MLREICFVFAALITQTSGRLLGVDSVHHAVPPWLLYCCHVSVGVVTFSAVLAVIWWYEAAFCHQLWKTLRSRKEHAS